MYSITRWSLHREAEAEQPERRAFLLSRSGHAGIQRHTALWTGDSASRWPHLRESLPMLMNLSLSGVAICRANIGGFAWSCTPELYARWIQIGARYPFARTHSMLHVRRQEPWRFGRRVEAIAKAALELRIQLLPYLDGLFRESEATGAPGWRPLFYEFPDKLTAAGVEDQVMVGHSRLAAPVLDRGAREVYLAAGVWTSLADGARRDGLLDPEPRASRWRDAGRAPRARGVHGRRRRARAGSGRRRVDGLLARRRGAHADPRLPPLGPTHAPRARLAARALGDSRARGRQAWGLCSICCSEQSQASARGTRFWRCLRAEREPAFLEYPPLPVRSCRGFEAAPGTRRPG
jgi:hypothetical protein